MTVVNSTTASISAAAGQRQLCRRHASTRPASSHPALRGLAAAAG